uniref:Uncharacterized protein n=1 Tax=Romanomermis culicivorax TaxID=13658 RepID=A0A915HWW0_ROMCU
MHGQNFPGGGDKRQFRERLEEGDQAIQFVLTYGLTCRNVESVELALQVLASLSDDKLTKQTAKSLVHRRIEVNSQLKSYESLNLSNVEDLAQNVDDGLNLRIEESQSQIGQIVESYEKKIIASQTKERQLQEAKTFALQQSDRTLEQYRIAKQDAEKEALKLHASLHSSECKRERIRQELEALKLNLKAQKQLESDLQQSCRDLKSELDASKDAISDYKLKIINMQQVEETYKREIESEKEMHDVLRKHYDTMKQNFKTTSEKLLKVEDELEQSKKQFINSSTTIKELKDKISDLIDKSNIKDETARTLKEKVQELESEIVRKQTTIKELERMSSKMKEEIDKHAQIADMIHKLTANK